jgi:uncharacterized protein
LSSLWRSVGLNRDDYGGPVTQTSAQTGVRWRRIGLFYAIAFGWATLVAAALFVLGQRNLGAGGAATWVGVVLAVGYMPVPLVAALILEKLDGRGFGLRRLFTADLRRQLVATLVVVAAVVAALLVSLIGLNWVAGNLLGVTGAGRVLFTSADLVSNIIATTGTSMNADQVAALTAQVPSLWLLVLITFGTALLVGFTINGVFALGEEYGWRGWLADELRPLGAVRANVLTGLLWGLWHAPLILLGYNYGSYRLPGVVAMMAWAVAASFLLWRVRELTGSVLAAAVLHGAFNGFAGIFVLILVDANPLISAPLGAVGIAAVALVAALLWWFTRRLRPSAAPAEPTPSAVQEPATA